MSLFYFYFHVTELNWTDCRLQTR